MLAPTTCLFWHSAVPGSVTCRRAARISKVTPGTFDDTSWLAAVGQVRTDHAQPRAESPAAAVNFWRWPPDFNALAPAGRARRWLRTARQAPPVGSIARRVVDSGDKLGLGHPDEVELNRLGEAALMHAQTGLDAREALAQYRAGSKSTAYRAKIRLRATSGR